MKKLRTFSLLITSPLILAGCLQSSPAENKEPATPAATPDQSLEQQVAPEVTEGTQIYTLDMIAEHNSPSDCWIGIEGMVYDVTPFIADQAHPGGPAILQGCGKDATEMFNERPNGSGAHSQDARSMLPQYYIGDLAE